MNKYSFSGYNHLLGIEDPVTAVKLRISVLLQSVNASGCQKKSNIFLRYDFFHSKVIRPLINDSLPYESIILGSSKA